MAAEDFDAVEANAGSGGALFAMNSFLDASGDARVLPFSAIVIPDGVGYARITAANPFPVTGPLTDTQLRATALPLPTGAASAANQATEIAGLASIDGHIDGIEASLSSLDTKTPSPASITGDNVAAPSAPNAYSFAMVYDGANWDRLPGTSADGILVNLGANNDVDTELPAAAALADGAANPTAPAVGSCLLVWNTATWDRLRGDTANGMDVDVTRMAALVPGNAVIGKVGIDQTTPGTTNFVQNDQTKIAGTAIDVNSGAKSAGTQRMILASDDAAVVSLALLDNVIFTDDAAFTPGTSNVAAIGLQADESSADSVDEGDIGCPRMTLDRKQIVTDLPHTAGGLTMHKTVSAASTNATSVKGAAGQLYEIMASNVNAAARYLKLYNKATAPTVGTDTPVWTLLIPGNTAGAGIAKSIPKGLAFDTGIAFALTTEATDAGSTGVAASDLVVNLGYK